jgi:hypothetical protein
MIGMTKKEAGRERRRAKRGFDSFKIRYGLDFPEHAATARRLSEAGLFIATNLVVFSPDVHLVLEIDIRGTTHRAAGVVRHSKKVDPRFVMMMKPGMGIEFTVADETLREAIRGRR